MPAATTLNVTSLNCWGLKYISTHRRARLAEIGARLAAADPPADVVGLQECWTREDYEAVRAATAATLPHGKFYHSGIFGGGLAVLSRWPIEEASMVRYPLNGRPTAFFRGDWFVGKGVACARIRYGPARRDVLEVFCTHLHAPYETEPFDSYLCHRTAQAWEIAKLMKGAAERGHLVLGLGDFNMRPLSLAHQLIEAHSPTRDVWRILHPNSSVGATTDAVEQRRHVATPTAGFNLTENGATCDSVLNTWRWDKARQKRLDRGEDIEVSIDASDPKGKRLDYVFFAPGEPSEDGSAWTAMSARVGMTGRHPTLKCTLSDHFSVEATFERVQSNRAADGDALRTSTAPPVKLHSSPISLKPHSLPLAVYDEILDMIGIYTKRERRQRRLRLSHFGGQVVVSIGCLVAVWWSPANFVSFLLMLISTLGLSAGVLDGLIGGLFVGSELRALKEFAWEVTTARAAAAESDSENSGGEGRE